MTIQEIKQAIKGLTPSERAKFRQWYEEYDAKEWDEQFERHVKSGKLQKLADKAVSDYRAGKAREL